MIKFKDQSERMDRVERKNRMGFQLLELLSRDMKTKSKKQRSRNKQS